MIECNTSREIADLVWAQIIEKPESLDAIYETIVAQLHAFPPEQFNLRKVVYGTIEEAWKAGFCNAVEHYYTSIRISEDNSPIAGNN